MSIIACLRKRRFLKRVYSYIKSRDYDKAVSELNSLDEEKLDEDYYYALSLAYLAQGNTKESMEAIDSAIEKDRGNPALIVHKAKILQRLKLYEESSSLLESSKQLTLFNEEILYIQAINYLALNDPAHANELFYEALKTIDKRFVESRIAMAVELFLLKNRQ